MWEFSISKGDRPMYLQFLQILTWGNTHTSKFWWCEMMFIALQFSNFWNSKCHLLHENVLILGESDWRIQNFTDTNSLDLSKFSHKQAAYKILLFVLKDVVGDTFWLGWTYFGWSIDKRLITLHTILSIRNKRWWNNQKFFSFFPPLIQG